MIRPIPTQRHWLRRAGDAVHDYLAERAAQRALHELDRRTLADIGLDASEITSVAAESSAHASLTRLRIVAVTAHV